MKNNQKEIEIVPFKSMEFGELNALVIDGENWFVGKDTAELLGYKDVSKAIRMHCEDAIEVSSITTLQNVRAWNILESNGFSKKTHHSMKLITESDLYSLIISSKLQTLKYSKNG